MRKISSKYTDFPSLNIIPLLDVLLVLVVILIMLTPYMAKAISVDLPAAAKSSAMTQDTAITLEVHADGSVWVDGAVVSDWSKLKTKLQGATSAKVYADKGAAFAAIAQLLSKLSEYDIHAVNFGVKA